MLFLLCAAFSSGLFAQKFTLSGELRTRTEYRDGYKTLLNVGDKHAYHTTQRTKLNFNYQHNNLETYISFQDVRFWGEIPWKKNTPSVFLNEAWAKLIFEHSFIAKIGRQPLVYDNQRLFTISNWSQITAKHDALKLMYRNKGWEIDYVTAFNQSDNLLNNTL